MKIAQALKKMQKAMKKKQAKAKERKEQEAQHKERQDAEAEDEEEKKKVQGNADSEKVEMTTEVPFWMQEGDEQEE